MKTGNIWFLELKAPIWRAFELGITAESMNSKSGDTFKHTTQKVMVINFIHRHVTQGHVQPDRVKRIIRFSCRFETRCILESTQLQAFRVAQGQNRILKAFLNVMNL